VIEALKARPHARDGLILAIACIAQFMVVLDVSIVNIALPSIRHDLHFSPSGILWVVNAYVLTFAGFLLLGGRMADVFGRRRVYLAGLFVFTIASIGAGVAQTTSELVAVRALQGIGGAILSPATLTIIVTTFRGAKLPRAIGIWSAVAGGGGAVGVLLGGVLVGELTWRWIFFINVPIGLAAGIIALRSLQELRDRDATHKIDLVGAILATAGLAMFVFGLVNTSTAGWGSASTLTWIGVSLIVLSSFVFWEQKVATNALLPFRIFKSRSLLGADITILFTGAAFFAMWYFLSFYVQNVLGWGPLRAGLSFAPMCVGIIAGAQISSRLINRLGVRPLILAGNVLAAVSFLWLSRIGVADSYVTVVLPGATLCAFAIGIVFTPLAHAATSGVDRADAGLASGVLNAGRQVGGSLGLAALATAQIARSNEFHVPASRIALAAGYQRAFFVSGLIMFVAFFATWMIPRASGRLQTADAPAPELAVAIE
jgi:EmrB/QacA subfamily drug resistance transporter